MSRGPRNRGNSIDGGKQSVYDAWYERWTGACTDQFGTPTCVISSTAASRIEEQTLAILSANAEGLRESDTTTKFSTYSIRGYPRTDLNAAYDKWTDTPAQYRNYEYLNGDSNCDLGNQDWFIHLWCYLESGTYSTGAEPYGIVGNATPDEVTNARSWNVQIVPNVAGDFQTGFSFTSASGDHENAGGVTSDTSFVVDQWNWYAAQGERIGDTTRITSWWNGDRIGSETYSPDLHFDLNQLRVGIGGSTGWGASWCNFWPGYIDKITIGHEAPWTWNQDISVLPTAPSCLI